MQIHRSYFIILQCLWGTNRTRDTTQISREGTHRTHTAVLGRRSVPFPHRAGEVGCAHSVLTLYSATLLTLLAVTLLTLLTPPLLLATSPMVPIESYRPKFTQ